MIKNLFLFLSLGFILVSGLDQSFLKSQKIDCEVHKVKLACDLLQAKN